MLFGAGHGTTLGSFGGRVDAFLASLAPDIGSRSDPLTEPSPSSRNLPSNPPNKNSRPAPGNRRRRRAETRVANFGNQQSAAVALLQPPAFDKLCDELCETKAEVADPVPPLAIEQTASLGSQSIGGRSPLFEQIKTGLAAFGVLSLALMVLKAAG